MVKQKAVLFVGTAFFLSNRRRQVWGSGSRFIWVRTPKEWAPGPAKARPQPMGLAKRDRGGVALRNPRRAVLPRIGKGGRRKGRIDTGISLWIRPPFGPRLLQKKRLKESGF